MEAEEHLLLCHLGQQRHLGREWLFPFGSHHSGGSPRWTRAGDRPPREWHRYSWWGAFSPASSTSSPFSHAFFFVLDLLLGLGFRGGERGGGGRCW